MIIEKHIGDDLLIVKPDNYDGNKQYPMVMHLHGTGGRPGLDSLVNGELPKEIQQAVDAYGFVAVAPHTSGDWVNKDVLDAHKAVMFKFNIDPMQCYLLGTSLGGGGLTKFASSGDGDLFAAYVSACGLNWASNIANIAKLSAPCVFFHAQNDSVVGVSNTNNLVSAINGLNPITPAKKVIYPTGDHWIWGRVWSPSTRPWTGNETPATIWEWLLMNKRFLPVPVPEAAPGPVGIKADAGPDFTTTVQETKVDGIRSAGYTSGTSCNWQVLSVPPGANPYNIFYKGAGYITCDIRLMVPGPYRFLLTVRGTDAGGKAVAATDELVVTYAPANNPTPVPSFAPTHSIERKDGSVEEVIIKTK